VIRGYPQQPSVRPGGTLTLRVSTDAPRFRVDFYRCGDGLRFQQRSGWLPGVDAPDHLPYQDWGVDGTGLHGEPLAGWAGYDFPVPPAWPPGVYLAVLDAGDAARPVSSPDARDGTALFVVLGAGAPILYKLPLFTYHAYNQVSAEPYDPVARRGGWCLYTIPEPPELPVPVPPTVSLRRPGGGTGGTPFDCWNADPYDPTPRQTFVHWDAPFIAWLERADYRADYCTDLDLHSDPELLGPYRLLVSVGHDEYWSDAMRKHAQHFVSEGNNAAFFSGNTCWKRVVFDDPVAFRRLERWPSTPVPDPENALTGVSFRNGGERDRAHGRVSVGFRVQHAGHWVYAGTGLRDGDVFGSEEALVGYECDGAEFDRADLERGVPVRPTGLDGTPPDFVILGVGDVRAHGWGLGNGAATMGVHSPGGTVFTAATTDWARLLATSPQVDRITRNVLDRLGTAGLGAGNGERP
jgi:hypothetical protein